MKDNEIEKKLIDSLNRQFLLVYGMLTYTFMSINVFIAFVYYYKNT